MAILSNTEFGILRLTISRAQTVSYTHLTLPTTERV